MGARGQFKLFLLFVLILIPLIIALIFLFPGEKEKPGVERKYICGCRALGKVRDVIVNIRIPSLNETGAISYPVRINLSIAGESVPCTCEMASLGT